MDGSINEIQFSSEGAVYGSIKESDLAKANFNWEVQTKLNFDFNVRGVGPNYEDPWEVKVGFFDVNKNVLWSDSRSGYGTEAGEDVHMEWVFTDQNRDLDEIVVLLEGGDAGFWKGYYGTIFRGMDLYLS